jgi:hypothetical protein
MVQEKVLVELELTEKEEGRCKSGCQPLIRDVCYCAKFLYQLYMAKRGEIILPNPESGEPNTIRIAGANMLSYFGHLMHSDA